MKVDVRNYIENLYITSYGTDVGKIVLKFDIYFGMSSFKYTMSWSTFNDINACVKTIEEWNGIKYE